MTEDEESVEHIRGLQPWYGVGRWGVTTPGIAQLGVLVQAVLEAYRNGSDADYSPAEPNFSQQWNSLSASEQQQVEGWRRSREYY